MSPYHSVTRMSPEERERRILEHLPQVNLIARRIHDRLPESANFEDLVSIGIIGLIAAIDNFDRSQNTQLKTYAEHRIRGAILDSLRQSDWAPRDCRKKSRQIQSTIARLEQSLQRTATEEEIAGQLGIPLSEYHQWLSEVSEVTVISLDYVSEREDSRDLLECISGAEEDLPSWILERAELQALLARAVSGLPKLERTVLGLYYQEELTLKEIGEILNLHSSRICQLKSQSILRIRSFIRKHWQAQTTRADAALTTREVQ